MFANSKARGWGLIDAYLKSARNIWLEALSGHNLRDGLQRVGSIGMSEIHRKWGSDRFKGRICIKLNGFDSVSRHKPRQRH